MNNIYLVLIFLSVGFFSLDDTNIKILILFLMAITLLIKFSLTTLKLKPKYIKEED